MGKGCGAGKFIHGVREGLADTEVSSEGNEGVRQLGRVFWQNKQDLQRP